MPTEVHQHFDAEDNEIGHTVITRESPWDDESRGRALRLAEYDAGICSCGSGLPIVECLKDQTFLVDHTVHYGKRALDKVIAAEDKAAEQQNRPAGWNDGWTWHVKVHKPDNAD